MSSFKIEGLGEFIKKLDEFDKKQSKKVLKKGLRVVANKMRDIARQTAPNDTGELKRHISSVVTTRNLSKGVLAHSVIVRKIRKLSLKTTQKLQNKYNNKIYFTKGKKDKYNAHVFYAHFVELGTKSHNIKAKNKKALSFSKGGKSYLLKSVHVKGVKGSGFMQKARQKGAKIMQNELVSELNKAINEFNRG